MFKQFKQSIQKNPSNYENVKKEKNPSNHENVKTEKNSISHEEFVSSFVADQKNDTESK